MITGTDEKKYGGICKCKKQKCAFDLLPFHVIEAASTGDTEAIQAVLKLSLIHIQMCIRDSSRQGEHGGGSVFPTSVVEDKNHIYIYGSGSKGEMFRYQEEKDAALLRYSLRKDGFAYLATESTGDICTKALRFYGEKLYLNVCAPYGVIKVRIPVSYTHLYWEGGKLIYEVEY